LLEPPAKKKQKQYNVLGSPKSKLAREGGETGEEAGLRVGEDTNCVGKASGKGGDVAGL